MPEQFHSPTDPKDGIGSLNDKDSSAILRFRTIWISDFHLGTRGCQAEWLLDFLKHTESEYLYLVGDIIDGWQLKKRWYWPQSHNDVVQRILRRTRNGTRVFYIPGNHDEAARDYLGLNLGEVVIADNVVHTTADGKKLLVLHGDQFDSFLYHAKWLAKLGNSAYTFLLTVNALLNAVRRRLGFSYWSLSAYLKHKVKNAMEHISAYESLVADEARRHKADGVICGHIHQPEKRMIGQVLYCNDGDWVESCTALTEDHDGKLSLINWARDRNGLLGSR